MPRKSSASRARIRRIGMLGLLLPTALTPAGIMVGTVTAAALIGGLAFHLNRATPVAPSTPAQSISAKAGNPQHLTIERDGKTVSLVMTEDELVGGGSAGAFDPAGPLFAGLAGDGPARRSAPGGMPPHASPGTSAAPSGGTMPGGAHSPTGPTSNSPSFAGPIGAPPGAGSSPAGSPPASTSPSRQPAGPNGTPPTVATLPTGSPPSGASPSTQPAPIRVAQPHSPGVNDAPAQPPGEAGAPASPHEPTQPLHGMPQDTLPAATPDTLTPPRAGEPFGPLTPPSGDKVTAQPNAVPEPSMIALMLLGLAGLAWAGRRRANPLRFA